MNEPRFFLTACSGYTPATGNQPLINGSTTPYTGDSQVGAASEPWRIVLIVGVLSVVTAALGASSPYTGSILGPLQHVLQQLRASLVCMS
jgi:hypothetical protein